MYSKNLVQTKVSESLTETFSDKLRVSKDSYYIITV